MLGHFLSHPLPETFNGVQVRTVCGKREQLKAKFFRPFTEAEGPMPRCPIPDDLDRLLWVTKPLSNFLQESNGVISVATTLIPNQALTIGEVIRTIPIDSIRQRGTSTHPIGRLSFRRPRVAEIHITMDMGFVNVKKDRLVFTDLLEDRLELLNKSSSLLGIGFTEYFPALFPTQSMCLE